LPEDLLTLFILRIFRIPGLLTRRARGAAGGDRLLLSGDRRIDIRGRRTIEGLAVIDAGRRRRAPSPAGLHGRRHLLQLDVPALLFEKSCDFLAHFLGRLALCATVDHPFEAIHRLVGARNALEQLKADTDNDAAYSKLIEECGGELGVIDNVISFAMMADTIGDHLTHNNVWAYDVAEAFGWRLVELLRGNWPDALVSANALSEILIAAEYDVDEVIDAIGRYLASPK